MAQTDFNLYKQDLDPNPEPHEIVREGKTITVTGISAKDFDVNGTSLYEALLEKRTNLRALKQQYIDLVETQQTCLAGPIDYPPVINLTGANPSIVYLGIPYTEPGFTANDNEDGTLTGSVTVTGSVDHNTLGNYTLTYTVTDSDGNTTNIDRTVNVIANNSPVITLTGSAVTITAGDTYVEPGYAASDSEDGDLTAGVVVTGILDTNTIGTYTLTYSVTDSHNNTVTATRTVNVLSNTVPVITLIGSSTIDVNVGDTYVEPGYSANDAEDGDLTSLVTVSFFEVTNGGNVVSSVDTATAGQYLISYNVEDSDGNPHGIDRTVNVVTNNSPVITLLGPASVTINVGDTYVDPGYTATDSEDGDITTEVSVSFFETTNGGNVVFGIDTSTAGQYLVSYYVEDSDGNFNSLTRAVNVATNDSPVITLIGPASITINTGDTYVEPGYAASDTEDGDLTSLVTVSFFEVTNGGNVVSSIDTSTAGQYLISYSVEDSNGNPHGIDRTVNVVVSNPVPVITLLGPETVTLNVGDTYFDPGYTATDAEDGDITAEVSVSFFETTNGGNVVFGINTSTAGQYLVSYYVEDSDGNFNSITRAVNVVVPVVSFRSVIFDLADNWGHSSILGIRSIEFKLNGVLIPPTGVAGYATTQFNSTLSAQRPFINPSKIGNEKGWLAASVNPVQSQRLQVVFPSIVQFDEIVINNQHSSGSFTTWGARNIVITGSTDEITDTTYGASIANSTELFDGELAQHVTSDVADDQVIWTAS